MNLLKDLPDPLTREQEDALAGGSEDDLNKLVLSAMKQAFKYAKGVCKSRIQDDELLSLCYSALSASVKRFQPGRIGFLAYSKADIRGAISKYWKSTKIVQNEDWDHKPEIRRSWTTSLDEAGAGPPETDESESSIEPDFESIHTAERWKLIQPALQKLNSHERMVLILRYRLGYVFEEIGELLGVSRSAVQNTHSRALKKLQDWAGVTK